jgi:probable phosphoglycerate mutase
VSRPTSLLLVRHGETLWHRENRYAGSSDIGLAPAGQAQAALLADVLATWAKADQPAAIACSRLLRSRLTAAPSAEVLGIEPEIHDDLREVHFGSAEGRTLAEIRADDPAVADAFVNDPLAAPFPGAEPLSAAADRMVGCLRSLADGYRSQRVLVVGHNTAIRLALCQLLGIGLSHYRQVLAAPDNVAMTELQVTDRLFRLVRFNVSITAASNPVGATF